MISAVFYGGLLVVLAGVLFQVWAEVLPSRIAAEIGHNSEAYVAALAIGAWVQYVRPRLVDASNEWMITGAAAMICLGAGVGLIASDWASRFRTLNETFLALALLLPYLQRHRRPSRRVAVGLAVAVLVVVLVSQQTQLGTDLAESFGMLMLAPIAFDAVDRSILQPTEYTSPGVRYGWYAAMIVLPVTMTVLEYEAGVGGLLGEITRYGVRIHESFIAMFLLEIYFVVALGRAGTRDRIAETPLTSHVSR